MDKELINNKIDDLEAELQKLKQLANTPEQRTPEVGDVFQHGENTWMHTSQFQMVATEVKEGSRSAGYTYSLDTDEYIGTYLGKFDEVYVKISDVRDALSIKDKYGDSVLVTRFNDQTNIHIDSECSSKTYEALRNLNIIND